MSITSKLKNTTRGAAFTEYVILLGLVGVVSIFAVVELGGTIENNFNDVESELIAQVLATQESTSAAAPAVSMGPPAPTLTTISATPYTPNTTGRDAGRFYEEFVVIRAEQGGAPYQHTWAFADDYMRS